MAERRPKAQATGGAESGASGVAVTALRGVAPDTDLAFDALHAALQRPTAAEVVAEDRVAVLVAPGQPLAAPPTAADAGLLRLARPEAGPGVTEGDGTFVAQSFGYLHVRQGRISVLSPVWVSPDGLEAHFIAFRPAGPPATLTAEQLRAALAAAGVTEGLDEAALTALAASAPQETGSVRLAVGTPAVAGQDARLEFELDIDKRAGKPLPDGTIDLRERNAAVGVRSGQLVARALGATEGQPGRTVRGEDIPASDGAAEDYRAGDNVTAEVDGDGTRFVAAVDGNVAIEGDTVHVRTVFRVSGDVDYDSGNIDVPGDVEVGGSVLSGFQVKAGGTVTVGGSIEAGARVQAHGDILASRGIYGQNTRVVAGGNLTTKFIQGCVVAAAGDIVAGAYIFNSQVRAGGAVRVETGAGKRSGAIIGGQVTATTGVQAQHLGSSETDRTLISMQPPPQLVAQATKLRKANTTLELEVRDLKAALGITDPRDRDQVTRLLARTPAPKLDDIEARLKDLSRKAGEAAAAQKSLEELEHRMHQALGTARVRAAGRVHPDTHVQFNQQVRRVDAEIEQGCEFYRDREGKVQWRALAEDTAGARASGSGAGSAGAEEIRVDDGT